VCLSVCLSVIISLHTRTHTHTHTHTDRHARTHARTHAHTDRHANHNTTAVTHVHSRAFCASPLSLDTSHYMSVAILSISFQNRQWQSHGLKSGRHCKGTKYPQQGKGCSVALLDGLGTKSPKSSKSVNPRQLSGRLFCCPN